MLFNLTFMLITSTTMATSLTKIADSLVPEDQRKKPDKKKFEDDEDDEDFAKQMELAIKLSLNGGGVGDGESDPARPNSTPKNKKNKSKKIRHPVPKNEPKNANKAGGGVRPTFFSPNNLTDLSYEQRFELAQARSKFDAADVSSSPGSEPDEEDLLLIALQKSTDPSEQINLDDRLLFEAIEASKAEATSNSFLDSDASSSTSSSMTSYRPRDDVLAPTYVTPYRLPNDVFAPVSSSYLLPPSTNDRYKNGIRRRGGGGTNRPLSDQLNHFNLEPGSEEDEDLKLAIQLSLQLNSNSLNRQKRDNNSYSAAASKLTSSTSLPSLKSAAGSNRGGGGSSCNVFADPLKVITNPNPPIRSCPGARRRPIIVDGCNVAFQHGKNDRYSAKGLLLVYQYFVTRHGYTNAEITIINKYSKNLNDEDKKIVDGLYKIDVLIYSPSRLVGGHLISSDDDLFVLNLAKEKNGVVVSLDQFRDAYSKTKDREIKDVIKHRILQFCFKGDEVFFPKDPMGPTGPTLEEFLKY